ncbi:MAG TPA: hypothetical protein GXX22_02710 [Clostridiales bacterium]|nr:hypothetical protein [Clostridiales bacterium]
MNTRLHEVKLLHRITVQLERWLLITISLLGISGTCNLLQCAFGWCTVIAFAEIAKSLLWLYYQKEKTACEGRRLIKKENK